MAHDHNGRVGPPRCEECNAPLNSDDRRSESTLRAITLPRLLLRTLPFSQTKEEEEAFTYRSACRFAQHSHPLELPCLILRSNLWGDHKTDLLNASDNREVSSRFLPRHAIPNSEIEPLLRP